MDPASPLLLGIGEALLGRPAWAGQAEIASAVGTTRSAVHPWVNYLLHHRALVGRAGELRVDRNRLLAVLTANRVAAHRPERPIACDLDVDGVHTRLEDAGVRHVFSFFSAANQWAFYEPRRDVYAYVGRGSLRQIGRLIPGSERSPDVRSGRLHLFVENPPSIRTLDRGGVPVTDPLLTVLDLRAHPEGGAHAAFVEQTVLRRMLEARR